MVDKKKTQESVPEFGTYQEGDKTYHLATLTARRLEQVGGLLAGIPVEDLLNAYFEIEARIENAAQRAKNQGGEEARLPSPDDSGLAMTDVEGVLEEVDVDVSLTSIVTALMKVLPAVSEQSLLVKFVAVALNIDEKAAADLPAKLALEVVPDFFTANKGLLKTSLRSSLPGMILARQVTTPPSAETIPKTETP